MKIKDDLAGTEGKCPKCKTAFVVPGSESPVGDTATERVAESAGEVDNEADEYPDMPLELTPIPQVQLAPAAEAPPARSRDRKRASETRKATRISSARVKPRKSSGGDGEFDPTDVLFEEDADESAAPMTAPVAERPTGRVLAQDAEADDLDEGANSDGSMAAMFKDFVPAGAHKTRQASAVASTSAAAEALARRAEEKKQSSADGPADPDDEDSEILANLQDLIREYGTYIAGFLGIVVALYFGMDAMLGNEAADLPPLERVYGTLTRAGEPFGGAQLNFQPADETVDSAGALAITDEGGEYDVVYVAGHYGLPAGTYTVNVTGPDGIFAGSFTVIVEAGKKKEYNLALP